MENKLDLTEIKKNPHKYIMGWMEDNLKHVGAKVFEVLALQPCSLILPKIHFQGVNIKASFNILLLGSPSSGKSTICDKYENIAYSPYKQREISSAQLNTDLAMMEQFSFILEDLSHLGEDYDTIKVLEGALGEEGIIQKRNKREKIKKKVNGVGLLCGTWGDLGKYLNKFSGGFFFRNQLIFIDLTKDQKSDIGAYINDGIGNLDVNKDILERESVIKRYYEELATIMAGEHKEIPQIHGYHFDSFMKDNLYKQWKKYNDKYSESEIDYNFTRELHEGYKVTIASALLNVFSRKIIDGVLYPTKEDFDLGKKLMRCNLKNKISILISELYLRKNRSTSDIRVILTKDNVDSKTKKILLNLYRNKYK